MNDKSHSLYKLTFATKAEKYFKVAYFSMWKGCLYNIL